MLLNEFSTFRGFWISFLEASQELPRSLLKEPSRCFIKSCPEASKKLPRSFWSSFIGFNRASTKLLKEFLRKKLPRSFWRSFPEASENLPIGFWKIFSEASERAHQKLLLELLWGFCVSFMKHLKQCPGSFSKSLPDTFWGELRNVLRNQHRKILK